MECPLLAFFLAVPPLSHRNPRSNLTIHETLKVKAYKLILWILAEVRRESGGSARIMLLIPRGGPVFSAVLNHDDGGKKAGGNV